MKNALEEISAGILKNVIRRIQENELTLNTNNALKLVICCCTVCNKNECEVRMTDLCLLLNICSTHIKELNEVCLNNYLQSVYHIMKYVLQKNVFVLPQLEYVLLPKFLPRSLTGKQLQITACISTLIYNAVLKEAKQKDCVENATVVASMISLKLFARGVSLTEFLERLYKFLQIFSSLSVDFTLLNEFYCKCLSNVQEMFKDAEKLDSVFRAFLSIIRLFTKAFSEILGVKELQTVVDATFETLKEFCGTKEQVLLHGIIRNISKSISGVSNATDLQSSYNDLKSTIRLHGASENLLSICQTISLFLMKVCRRHSKHVDIDEWQKTFPVKVQLGIYSILQRAAGAVEKCRMQCTCRNNCEVKAAVFESVNLLYIVALMCKLSLSRNMNSNELTKVTLSCLEKSCTHIVALKNSGCSSWKSSWMETGCVFYNLGVNLYSAKDPETLPYFRSFTRYLIQLEGTAASVIKDNALDTALLCHTEMCYRQEDYAGAMKMAALQILLRPEDCDSACFQWIKTKSAAEDKCITVVDTIQKAESELKDLLPDLNLDADTAGKMLIAELEHYKSQWPSKIAMMCAFKKLLEFTTVSEAARVFVRIWGNSTASVNEELLKLLCKLLTDYKETVKMSDFEGNIILACLYYCQYKYKAEEIVSKNSAEIKRNTISIKQPLPPYDVPLNPNDECDIVTLCGHLTCESQMKTTQLMDKALDIFERYSGNFGEEHVDFLKTFEIPQLLIQIGQEYQLHCYSNSCIRAWIVEMKLAKVIVDDFLILEAATSLLEFADMKSELAVGYIQLARNILLGLSASEKTAKQWEIVTNFYVTLSLKYLGIEDFRVAYEEFEMAQKCFDELQRLSNSELIQTKFLFLQFKLILLPCSYNLLDHQKNTAIKIHKAMKTIMEYFKGAGRKSSYAISLLFDITYTVASWYRWLHLPREVRCYAREVAVLAQQLVSPLRAARFLVVLAHADLLSCRICECRMKVFGIATILCLPKQQCELAMEEEKKVSEDLEVVDLLSSEMGELSLDLPLSKDIRSSPVVVKDTFKLPSFLGHPSTCERYCCSCLEYQELTVMQAHLEALLSMYLNDSSSEVQEYFAGSLNLLKRFSRRLGTDGPFWEVHANILLDYGNVILSGGHKQFAAKVNTKLLSLLSNRKLSNMYLFNAAHLQKLNISWQALQAGEKSLREDEDDAVVTNGSPPKTPELKVSEVTIRRSPQHLLSIPKIPIKKRLFKLDDEDDVNVAEKLKTPVKTPEGANLKVKIFTPAEVKTVKKKNPVTASKVKSKDVKSNLLPTESVASACGDPKADRLRSKTKLLTEKIKKELKDDKGITAKKNLLSALADPSAAEESKAAKAVATRKSSRSVRKR